MQDFTLSSGWTSHNCSLVPGYQLGLVGLAIVLGAAIVWFLFVGRHHLVAQAPEEATALMSQGRISRESV